MDRIVNIIAGMAIGALIMWIVMINIKDKPIILNEDELNRRADEKAKHIIDSVRTLPLEQRIDWVMSDQ